MNNLVFRLIADAIRGLVSAMTDDSADGNRLVAIIGVIGLLTIVLLMAFVILTSKP